MPKTKEGCFPKVFFSADWQCYGGCQLCFLGAGTGVPAEIWSGTSLLHSGQTEAARACGWAPVVPGAGLPGWPSPGEVTPACQNLPALDRELPLPRMDPYPCFCNMQSMMGRNNISWRQRKVLFLFSPVCLSHSGCIQQYQECQAYDWPVISIKPIWSSLFS